MISTDEFIQYALDSSIQFESAEQELTHLKKTTPILRDEVLTCYQYLKEHGLFEDYSEYRG